MPKNRVASTNKPLPKISTVAREKPVVCMADPGLGIKDFSLLAVAPSGEQRVDLVVNPLPKAFFCRPAELVAPELIGCLLVKRQADGELLWGVIVETEAYSQDDPACHGYRRRTPSNETLFGEPGRFYVYVSYGIHHCVKVVYIRSKVG